MQHLDTRRLLDQAQRGNAVAIEFLLDRYRDRLCRLILIWLDSRLSARLDPADIVQHALLNAAIRLPKYLAERPVAFFPWLKSLVKDELIRVHREHLQAQRRSVEREQAPEPSDSTHTRERLGNSLVSQDLSPGQQAIVSEQTALVRQVLTWLSAGQREILLMRYAQQMSIRAIAEATRIGQATARSRLCRARQSAARLIPESMA